MISEDKIDYKNLAVSFNAKPLTIVTDSVSFRDACPEPTNLTFSLGYYGSFLRHLMGDMELPTSEATVIIETAKEYIYRPKNLKYPNKKRAKRIWKKWKKRYGSKQERIVLPNSTIKAIPNDDGSVQVSITPNP